MNCDNNIKPTKNDHGFCEEPEVIRFFGAVGAYGVTCQLLLESLRRTTKPNILIIIDSTGGDAVEGLAIAAIIRNTKKHITTRLDGSAYGVAAVILMAGDVVEMTEKSFLMFTNSAALITEGMPNIPTLRKLLKATDKAMSEIFIQAIKKRSPVFDEDAIRKVIEEMMTQGTVLSAEEAYSRSLIDKIV